MRMMKFVKEQNTMSNFITIVQMWRGDGCYILLRQYETGASAGVTYWIATLIFTTQSASASA